MPIVCYRIIGICFIYFDGWYKKGIAVILFVPFIKNRLNHLAYGSILLRKASDLLTVCRRVLNVVKHVKKPPITPVFVKKVCKGYQVVASPLAKVLTRYFHYHLIPLHFLPRAQQIQQR